jgi:uncharacterized OB-fold protein
MSDSTYPLLPKISDDTAPFWQGCKERRLLFQKCSECGHVRYPASFGCPQCLSPRNTWIESKGRGSIYSFVVFQRAFHPSMADRIPYTVAVVEIEEGPSFLTNIVGCDPTEVHCGQKVRLQWENAIDGLPLPMFRPVKEGKE